MKNRKYVITESQAERLVSKFRNKKSLKESPSAMFDDDDAPKGITPDEGFFGEEEPYVRGIDQEELDRILKDDGILEMIHKGRITVEPIYDNFYEIQYNGKNRDVIYKLQKYLPNDNVKE